MEKIKGAIFDMDGTLIDSLTFWNYFWRNVGKDFFNNENFRPAEEVDKKCRTFRLEDSAKYIHKVYSVGKDDKEAILYLTNSLKNYYINEVGLKSGAYEFLEYLYNNNVKIVIATATSRPLVEIIVKKLNIDKFISNIYTCDEVGIGKESPKIFLHTLRQMNLNIKDVIVFEDSYLAVQSAKSVGFKVVGIYDKFNFSQNEIKKIADYYVDNGETLLKLI